jgi:hypothetical protein
MVLEGRGASGARTSRDSIPKSEVKISAGPQMEKSAMRDGDGEFSNSEWLSKPLKSHRADKFQGRMRETMSDNSDSSRASWPILLGGFPVVANILFSGSNQWVEVAIIIMIMVWIYYILQSKLDIEEI